MQLCDSSITRRHDGLKMVLAENLPMLGNCYGYQNQMSLAMNEGSETWKISFTGQPQEAIKIASDWNRMPHRRVLLRDLAPALMLQHKGTLEYLTRKKAEWAKLSQ